MAKVWAIWLLILVISFGLLEWYAIAHNDLTLSMTVWSWSNGFPLLPWLGGVLAGGLAVHFWWRNE